MKLQHSPPRTLPLLYLATAHVSLGLACAAAGLWPRAVAGFFYHSWMVAIVHLVTLGWITCSILGAIYIVGPIALRTSMPVRRADYVAYAFVLIGIVGMVGHFWIQEYGGMAWSAATVTTGVVYMAIRIIRAVTRREAGKAGGADEAGGAGGAGRIGRASGAVSAKLPAAVKLHIVFACVNVGVAASLGVLLGFDKVYHFLPGFVLSNVFAHAHLAAVGWATMMVVGVGYRLLPMLLPSRMPGGRSVFASAVLLEIGVLGLFVTLLVGSAWTVLFGLLIVAGLAVFGAHVIWMLRSPASKPAGAPRVDFSVLHAASAGVSLAIAVTLGMLLLAMPASPRMLHAAAAYGVFGLIGFLAQMVVAMESKLLPLATWFWTFEARLPPPPFTMHDRTLQTMVFAGWTVGVPMLAAGMFLESPRAVAIGAWALFAALAIGTLDNVLAVLQLNLRVAGASRYAA